MDFFSKQTINQSTDQTINKYCNSMMSMLTKQTLQIKQEMQYKQTDNADNTENVDITCSANKQTDNSDNSDRSKSILLPSVNICVGVDGRLTLKEPAATVASEESEERPPPSENLHLLFLTRETLHNRSGKHHKNCECCPLSLLIVR